MYKNNRDQNVERDAGRCVFCGQIHPEFICEPADGIDGVTVRKK